MWTALTTKRGSYIRVKVVSIELFGDGESD